MASGDTKSEDSYFNDFQLNANEAEMKSDEYEQAFEDVRKCPMCGEEGSYILPLL